MKTLNFSCFRSLTENNFQCLLLELFFLDHIYYESLKLNQLITLFCRLMQKSQLKIKRMYKNLLLQSKFWILACCHCMKSHANHLIFSHHSSVNQKIHKTKQNRSPHVAFLRKRSVKRAKNEKMHFSHFSAVVRHYHLVETM